eukprot:scaffold92794_cov54-Phaeocystis_antarctica.AAC.4
MRRSGLRQSIEFISCTPSAEIELPPAVNEGPSLAAGPDFLAWRAEQLEDAVDLVKLAAARQQRLAQHQLGEDAAERPHVQRRPVGQAAEQQLGRAVPQGDHHVRVWLERVAVLAREAKVADLHHAAVVHEEVGRLEVAVQHPVLVAVLDGRGQVEHEPLHL